MHENVRDAVDNFNGNNGADAAKYVEELEELRRIDEAIKKLNIKIVVPKNTLTISQSLKKLDKIVEVLKAKKPPKIFDPNKDALKKMEIELPVSSRGTSVDFNGSTYPYPVKGSEKNILKIKLTGDRKFDKKLAYEMSKITPNKNYTWHHLDDYNPTTNTCTMQLVSKDIHEATYPHFGAVALIEEFFNITYK